MSSEQTARKQTFDIKNAKPKGSSSLDYAKKILQIESEAVLKVSELLDTNFDRAVQTILSIKPEGRVVVSGMGKAGFVGMKTSATFASTGTPSFFLHPADAVHGDLGRYTKHDVALVLSNSGETVEVLRTIPHIKGMGSTLIAITGDVASRLAAHADIVLSIGKITEVGPLALAPTCSTTAMLALGDALAMAVSKLKDFSREEYARYHPGGNIGRALTLVSEIMRSGDEHCVVLSTLPTRDVVHRIIKTKGRPGAASIVNEQGKLIGIFTDGDLRRCLDKDTRLLDAPVSEVMSKTPKTIEQGKLIQEALRIMSEFKIDEIIALDADGCPVGMVDIQDILEFNGRF